MDDLTLLNRRITDLEEKVSTLEDMFYICKMNHDTL